MYEYDCGGNITAKKRYGYTTGALGEVKQTITYEYDSIWKDQLKKFNGQTISYDDIGNPTSDGTWTYTWENGRQLAGMSKNGTTVSFKYNASGLRVQKTVNNVETNYTLHGKNIVHMKQGSNSLHFFYDAQNKPAVVVYNGTAYAYAKNLQGDIIAILNSAGTAVVSYTYDAWGAPTGTTGSMKDTLGKLNPFRYRSYMYDEETELYYLRSRFYFPHYGRFATADCNILLKCRIGDHNNFSYCKNTPIMRIDSNGTEDYPLPAPQPTPGPTTVTPAPTTVITIPTPRVNVYFLVGFPQTTPTATPQLPKVSPTQEQMNLILDFLYSSGWIKKGILHDKWVDAEDSSAVWIIMRTQEGFGGYADYKMKLELTVKEDAFWLFAEFLSQLGDNNFYDKASDWLLATGYPHAMAIAKWLEHTDNIVTLLTAPYPSDCLLYQILPKTYEVYHVTYSEKIQ